MAQEDFSRRADKIRAGIESTRRMGIRFRTMVVVLTMIIFLGLVLHNEITYTPVFPIILLIDSIVCLIAGTRADWISQGFNQFGGAAASLARSAVFGGMITLMFSVLGVSFGPGHSGHEKPWGDPVLFFNLSWPALVISLVAIVFGVRTYRRIRNLPK